MKKNKFVIERHAYAPELNVVRYAHNGAKLPGNWGKLSTAKNYAEAVRMIRAELYKGGRSRKNFRHYVRLTFADSGNVFAAGGFDTYAELREVMHRTGRTLNVHFY